MEEYNSLEAIRAKKTELNKEIEASEQEISALWNATFRAKKYDPNSKTQRFMAFASTASGIIDGALFGYKLYRKLHR